MCANQAAPACRGSPAGWKLAGSRRAVAGRLAPARAAACLQSVFFIPVWALALPLRRAVALFTNDVRAVPATLMLARAASVVIWQNIAFSVATKVRAAPTCPLPDPFLGG